MAIDRREFLLEAVSPVLLHGIHREVVQNGRTRRVPLVETRSQSFKGMLRWTMRTVLGARYDWKTVKKIDLLVNGDTSHASLWGLEVWLEGGEEREFEVPMVVKTKRGPRKMNIPYPGYPPGSRFRVVLYSEHEEILDFVEAILGALVRSFGVGQRWRHGFGKLKRAGGHEISKSDLNTILERLKPAVDVARGVLGGDPINLGDRVDFPEFPAVYVVDEKKGDFSATMKVSKGFRDWRDMIDAVKEVKAEVRNIFRSFVGQNRDFRWHEEWFFGTTDLVECPVAARYGQKKGVKRIPSRIIYRPLSGGRVRVVLLRVPCAGQKDVEFYRYLLGELEKRYRGR